MKKIILHLQNKNHPLYFSDGGFSQLPDLLCKHFKSSRWVLVTNPVVDRLYGQSLRKNLKSLGEVRTILIPEGERFKTLKTVEKIYRELSDFKVDRQTPILGLGGGVVGDVAGFAAATYLRGVPFVQIPTTLLAQVDSSVGGKTGVDLPSGKNLVGAFYQPDFVFLDTSTLKTLPRREILCGSAEVIKYGAILSSKLFSLLEKKITDFQNLDPSLLQKIVQECVQIKTNVVEKDEKEISGLRMKLNFGHTLGHAVETLSGYQKVSHGEGVAIGMAFAAKLSQTLGLCNAATVDRLVALLKKAELPTQIPKFSRKTYLEVMSRDKKMTRGEIRYVLIQKIGSGLAQKLNPDVVGNELEKLMK